MNIKDIPISQIRRAEEQLREVNLEGDGYLNLKGDLLKRGQQQNIVVVMKKDEQTGETYYVVNEGNHRLTAFENLLKETGDKKWATITAHIIDGKDIDDLEFYARQIAMNATQVETKPGEFTKAINRLIQIKPGMSTKEIAVYCGKSETWVTTRMSLQKLSDEEKELLETGVLNINNAIQLCRLDKDERPAFLERAKTMATGEFASLITNRVGEQKAAMKEGRKAEPEKFVAIPRLRPAAELKSELETHAYAKTFAGTNKKPEDVANEVILWAFRMDLASVKSQEDDWNAAQMAAKEKKAKKALENIEKMGLKPDELLKK